VLNNNYKNRLLWKMDGGCVSKALIVIDIVFPSPRTEPVVIVVVVISHPPKSAKASNPIT